MTAMRRRGLVWNIGVGLIAVQVLVAAVATFAGVGVVAGVLHRQSRADLVALCRALSAGYGGLVESGDTTALRARVATDSKAAGVAIAVIGSDGATIADSHARAAPGDNQLQLPEVAAALESGSGWSTRHSAQLGERALVVAVATPGPAGPRAVVRIAAPMAQVDGAVAAALPMIIAIVGAALLVSVAATLLAAGSLAASVRRMARAAEAFADGDLSARAPEHPSRELARLAEVLNRTAERMTAEAADLRARSGQQEAILQSMEAGVVALDLEHRIMRMNRAAEVMLGMEAGAVRGRLLQEVVREPELHRFVGEAMSDPAIQSAEFELRGEQPASVRATSGSLRDADGRPVGLLLVLTDVTQLRRLETMRTDFAANVSHELRTPITNIKGYLETLLESDLADRDQARRFLAVIARNAERLGAIVEDMLMLTRLERSGAEERLVTEPTPVARVIESVVAQLDPEIRAKMIAVVIDAPEGVVARINAQLVEQAVANLIMNAVKYSPARTRVTIGARRVEEQGEPAMVEVSVADEGPGIAPEHLQRIFERFYRVDRARSREQGGTGLGLAIVKHIALVHGGRVLADSVMGRGTTFRLLLPAA